jgi:cytosine/adenosine deaminase-related metal-dependent hydrolase
MKETYFSSDDQLVTLRILPRAAFPGTHPAVIQVRKDLDLWMSFDGGSNLPLATLYASGDYNGKESYNHGTNFSADQRQIVVENNAKVNICPRIDSQFGTTGRGIPWTQEWLDSGARPGISSDDPGTYAVDFFTEMHVMYAFQRGMANFNSLPLSARITVRDVLEFATIRGAECCAVDHKVGTLTPGKEADIVLINTNNISIWPKHNAILTVVEGASIPDVDTVFVAGKVRKWRGQLAGIDLNKIRQMSEASRDYLFAQTNWPKDTIDFSD